MDLAAPPRARLPGDGRRGSHPQRRARHAEPHPSAPDRRVDDAAGRLAPLRESSHCAGVDYPQVVTGLLDFVAYRRPRPWDHLAGGLMLTEMGGGIVHLDGSPWTPGGPETPIISSRDLDTARRVGALWLPYTLRS